MILIQVNDSGVELIEKMWKKWIDMMDKEEFKEEVFAMCDPPDSYTTSSDYGDALYAALDFVKRKKFQLWAHWAEQIRLEYNISQEDLDSVKYDWNEFKHLVRRGY